jgi:CheY-like chemotaxis protein
MKKVYVIDDDRDIVESLSIVLKSNNYEVAAQYDDEDVETKVKAFGPDLIVLDVMFPENSAAGFEIARRLKADEELAKIPIIMLSAVNAEHIYPGRFSNRDIDDSWLPVNMFLDKPVSPRALIDKVASLIGQ